jgi:hypothetical protein
MGERVIGAEKFREEIEKKVVTNKRPKRGRPKK